MDAQERRQKAIETARVSEEGEGGSVFQRRSNFVVEISMHRLHSSPYSSLEYKKNKNTILARGLQFHRHYVHQ